MQVKEIGYELSIRLGDPVGLDTPDEQGGVFSGAERFRYITRAYSKLTRLLKLLMRDYQPEFNLRKSVQFIPITPTVGSSPTYLSKTKIKPSIKIDELFAAFKKGTVTKTVPASYIASKEYLSHKYNVNDVGETSFDKGVIKYTIMNELDTITPKEGKPYTAEQTYIYLLPEAEPTGWKYFGVYYIETPDFKVADWESEIPITADYIDLLVDLAAIQGMQDIARGDKAALIERSVMNDLQILGQYGTYMKQTEGVKE